MEPTRSEPYKDSSAPVLVFWRRVAQTVLVFVALFLAGVLGNKWYRILRERHLMAGAAKYYSDRDYRNAALMARHAYQLNPYNVEAMRLIAQLAETAGVPDAVLWWAQITDMQPDRVENRFAWARSALRLGEFEAADLALAGVDSRNRRGLEYNFLASSLFVATGRYGPADGCLQELIKLDPQNDAYRLTLAMVRLNSNQPELVQEAIATLDRMRQKPQLGLTAARALFGALQARQDHEGAVRIGREIITNPDSEFADHIAFLDALFPAREREAEKMLSQLKEKAESVPADTAALMLWLNSRGRGKEVIEWVKAHPARWATPMPIRMALAEAFVETRDWSALAAMVSRSNWGDLDVVRLAFHSRALREMGENERSKDAWNTAMLKSENSPGRLAVLVRYVKKWKWDIETEQVLWKLAKNPRAWRRTMQSLYQYYMDRRDTKGLLRVSKRIMALEPADKTARNNTAFFSLLLYEDVPESLKLAEENHRAAPGDPAYASTYALALYRREKFAEALKIMNSLKPEYLREPRIATFHGLVLVANGKKDLARPYWALGQTAKGMLPEEELLLRELAKGVK